MLLLSVLSCEIALGAADRAIAQTSGDEAKPVEFRIPAQTVPGALIEFARQAHEQLFFITDGFEDVQANAVFDNCTSQKALDLLLAGTGLQGTLSPESGIKVVPVSDDAAGGSRLDDGKSAAARQSSVSQGTDEGQRPGNAVEEIVVVGTHIRGAGNVGVASLTFDRQELDNTGYIAVEDLFQSLLQNLDEISTDAITASGASAIAGLNSEGASGVGLRGLGPGSTLVLLNGKRRPGSIRGQAVDVSAIPLSMVERVEVVTGGGSAIYGSDAVAGMVNIVTRTEFDGAESQIYYGESPDGGERFNFSHTLGREYARGGFVLGYDYRKDQKLDATDAGVAGGPSSLGRTPLPGLYYLRAPSEQHVGLIAGRFELNDKAQLYGDARFSADKNEVGIAYDLFGTAHQGGVQVTDSDQYSAVAGIRLGPGKGWQVDLSALRGVVDNSAPFSKPIVFAPDTITSFDLPRTAQDDDESTLSAFSAIADGPLGKIRGSTVSVAIGVELRDESYKRSRAAIPSGTRVTQEDRDRSILSVFGELRLPLVNGAGQRLNASLAGRYDDYSDVGDTFNPQLGIDWEPISGLTFRGSYAEAFRAPNLYSLDVKNQILIAPTPDPLASGGTAITLGVFRGNPGLRPEEAATWTAGVDWEPSDRSRLSLSYFNIDYVNRIAEPNPALSTVLTNEDILLGLVNRSPTSAELSEVIARTDPADILNFSGVPFDPASDDPLAVFPGLVFFDGRLNNVAIEAVDGFDVQASTVLETASGDWTLDLSGTYYLDFKRNITAASPTIQQLNRPGKPVDLKLRGRIGWSRSAWNVNAYVNYVDSYKDTIAATPATIDSWTTVDLTAQFDASRIAEGGPFDGVRVTLGIGNLFDEDPPVFLSNAFGIRYDAVNADPIGRFVSLRVAKRW